jgi:hypothetical protein
MHSDLPRAFRIEPRSGAPPPHRGLPAPRSINSKLCDTIVKAVWPVSAEWLNAERISHAESAASWAGLMWPGQSEMQLTGSSRTLLWRMGWAWFRPREIWH